MEVFLGFDPGGKGKFGWAVCIEINNRLKVIAADVADHAKDALERSSKALPRRELIVAAGIDAPMFWAVDGDRESDHLVREAIRCLGARSPGGTVQSFNSLRGACVIQGFLILKLLRRLYPDLPITEAHPKALLWLMGIARRNHGPETIAIKDIEGFIIEKVGFDLEDKEKDKRDAILGAFTAQMMIRNKSDWVDLLEYEDKERIIAGEPPIGYWMPKSLFRR
jgi:hypothetical protein